MKKTTPPKYLPKRFLSLCASGLISASAIITGYSSEVLGTGAGSLLGGDLTDPENDLIDTEPGGSNFNWVSITSTGNAYFDADGLAPRQGAFDVFDNKVNNTEGKFCCTPAPWSVSVEFAEGYVLTHFTVTSNTDSIGRNPDVWRVQGSNDGVDWADIYVFDDDDAGAPGNRLYRGNSPWTTGDQVIRWNGDGDDFETPPSYKWFRFQADSAAGWVGTGGNLSLAEIEYFGTPASSAPFEITDFVYNAGDDTLRLTWNSKPGKTYTVRYSNDLKSWDSDIGDSVLSEGESTTFPPVNQPPAANPLEGTPRIYFRIEEN